MSVRSLHGRCPRRQRLRRAVTIVVNREFVRRFWPGQDPLGKRVNVIAETGIPSATPRTLVVAGVVENIKEWGRDEDPHPMLYEPAERSVESHVYPSGPVILIQHLRVAAQHIFIF